MPFLKQVLLLIAVTSVGMITPVSLADEAGETDRVTDERTTEKDDARSDDRVESLQAELRKIRIQEQVLGAALGDDHPRRISMRRRVAAIQEELKRLLRDRETPQPQTREQRNQELGQLINHLELLQRTMHQNQAARRDQSTRPQRPSQDVAQQETPERDPVSGRRSDQEEIHEHEQADDELRETDHGRETDEGYGENYGQGRAGDTRQRPDQEQVNEYEQAENELREVEHGRNLNEQYGDEYEQAEDEAHEIEHERNAGEEYGQAHQEDGHLRRERERDMNHRRRSADEHDAEHAHRNHGRRAGDSRHGYGEGYGRLEGPRNRSFRIIDRPRGMDQPHRQDSDTDHKIRALREAAERLQDSGLQEIAGHLSREASRVEMELRRAHERRGSADPAIHELRQDIRSIQHEIRGLHKKLNLIIDAMERGHRRGRSRLSNHESGFDRPEDQAHDVEEEAAE